MLHHDAWRPVRFAAEVIKGLVLWAIASLAIWLLVNGLNVWLFFHDVSSLSYLSLTTSVFIAFLLWIAYRLHKVSKPIVILEP